MEIAQPPRLATVFGWYVGEASGKGARWGGGGGAVDNFHGLDSRFLWFSFTSLTDSEWKCASLPDPTQFNGHEPRYVTMTPGCAAPNLEFQQATH